MGGRIRDEMNGRWVEKLLVLRVRPHVKLGVII